MAKPNKVRRFSRRVVVFCIAFITAYVITTMAMFWATGTEPSTLHKYVFGFFGGELMLLCVKRILGVKTQTQEAPQTSEETGTDDESSSG